MTGPSSTQLQLQSEEAAFYKQGVEQSETTFSEQQDLLNQMKQIYSPILAKGPNQEGFSPAEKAGLESQAIEGTAKNYSQAARAVGGQIAAEGGGNNPLPTGGSEQLREEVGASAAGEESNEQQQIEQADYAQGYQEFQGATAALETASGQLNPAAYENAATSAGNAAEETAKDINAEQNSWEAPVLGAIGAIGGGIATGGMSNLGKGEGFFGNG